MKLKRRSFLKTTGGGIAAVAFPGLVQARSKDLSVGIVGGGIIGATIAYHLARAGCKVTLFEKKVPASGATSGSFALINTISSDPHYRELRKQSVFAWRVLDLQLPLNVTWGGFLTWGKSADATNEAFAALFTDAHDPNYPKQFISADEFQHLAPNLSPGTFDSVIYTPMDGHVDPIHATHTYISSARKFGANTIYPCKVTDLEMRGDQLVAAITTKGRYQLDRIIIAGGVDTPELVAKAGFKPTLKHRPGILAMSTPTKLITSRALFQRDPMLLVKQLPSGVFVSYDAPHPSSVLAHSEILKKQAMMPEAISIMHGERILKKIRDIVPVAIDTELDKLILAYRPVPEDGMPIVGFVPNSASIYVAVMHSGVTLSAIMGQYVSTEVLGGHPVKILKPYRPNRFSS